MVKCVSNYFMCNFLAPEPTMYNLTMDDLGSGKLSPIRRPVAKVVGESSQLLSYVDYSFKTVFSMYVDSIIRQYKVVVGGKSILDNTSILGNPHGRQLAADCRWRTYHLKAGTFLNDAVRTGIEDKYGPEAASMMPSDTSVVDSGRTPTSEAIALVGGKYIFRCPDGKIWRPPFTGSCDVGTLKPASEVEEDI